MHEEVPLVARWQLKWYVRDAFPQFLRALKQAPRHARRGFLAACTGLIGLVAGDNLLGFSNSPYKNEVTVTVSVVVTMIAILFRDKSWGYGFRKVVMSII